MIRGRDGLTNAGEECYSSKVQYIPFEFNDNRKCVALLDCCTAREPAFDLLAEWLAVFAWLLLHALAQPVLSSTLSDSYSLSLPPVLARQPVTA